MTEIRRCAQCSLTLCRVWEEETKHHVHAHKYIRVAMNSSAKSLRCIRLAMQKSWIFSFQAFVLTRDRKKYLLQRAFHTPSKHSSALRIHKDALHKECIQVSFTPVLVITVSIVVAWRCAQMCVYSSSWNRNDVWNSYDNQATSANDVAWGQPSEFTQWSRRAHATNSWGVGLQCIPFQWKNIA